MIFTICFISSMIFLGYLVLLDYKYSCKHKYRNVDNVGVGGSGNYSNIIIVDRCTECGKLKRTKLR